MLTAAAPAATAPNCAAVPAEEEDDGGAVGEEFNGDDSFEDEDASFRELDGCDALLRSLLRL